MPKRSAVSEELENISQDLRRSLKRLQSLLERKHRALKEAEILDDRRECEHLEQVVRDIEKKIREIREIGFPPTTMTEE